MVPVPVTRTSTPPGPSSPLAASHPSVRQQVPEGPQVDVEVRGREAVAPLEVLHGPLKVHQPGAERLDLLVAEIALVDRAQRLLLHQLADQLDDGQHELEQVPL